MPPLTPRSMRRCWTPVASSELQRSRPGLATHQQANLEAPSCRRQSSGSSRAASRLIRHWSSTTLPVQCTATPTFSAVGVYPSSPCSPAALGLQCAGTRVAVQFIDAFP
uniref:Uncharacterized protein n=1 Tax=Triticum urartu TaxID=4572 RepID=A0A8R7UFS7_TRIUA